MVEPSFLNLLFSWAILAIPVIFVYGYSREWVQRFVVWAALWLTLTPVGTSWLSDFIWIIVCFKSVEWLFARAVKVKWPKAKTSGAIQNGK